MSCNNMSFCYKQRKYGHLCFCLTLATKCCELKRHHPTLIWYASMLCTWHCKSFPLTGDWTIFMRCLLILVTMAGMSTTPSWAACSRAVSMAISVPVLPIPALQGDSHHHAIISWVFPHQTWTNQLTHESTIYYITFALSCSELFDNAPTESPTKRLKNYCHGCNFLHWEVTRGKLN